MIDLYCERLHPGLWAEPVNALTNLSFFIAAILAWRLAVRSKNLSLPVSVLLVILLCIGAGSTLFHTFATPWAELADVLPIAIFQLFYLFLYLTRIARLPLPVTLASLIVFMALIVLSGNFPGIFNGSLMYAPAFLALFTIGLLHFLQRRKESRLLLTAAFIFLLSLTFRSLDMVVCPVFRPGTHFLWHILNGLLMYLLLRVFILNTRSEN